MIKPEHYFVEVKRATTNSMAHGARPIELSDRLHQLVIGSIHLRNLNIGKRDGLYEVWRETFLQLEAYNSALLDWACWGVES